MYFVVVHACQVQTNPGKFPNSKQILHFQIHVPYCPTLSYLFLVWQRMLEQLTYIHLTVVAAKRIHSTTVLQRVIQKIVAVWDSYKIRSTCLQNQICQ